MASLSPSIDALCNALQLLPGVGPKSAQRMTFQLLESNREGAERLANALTDALKHVKRCSRCRILCEADCCHRCIDESRDKAQLCIVEKPTDVQSIEQATAYRGHYFVLSGHLSPLDGVGPESLGIPLLVERLDEGLIDELILATNPTIEGEATAHFISELARSRNIKVTRLAHGIPMGGELEFIDSGTLSHAFAGRKTI